MKIKHTVFLGVLAGLMFAPALMFAFHGGSSSGGSSYGGGSTGGSINTTTYGTRSETTYTSKTVTIGGSAFGGIDISITVNNTCVNCAGTSRTGGGGNNSGSGGRNGSNNGSYSCAPGFVERVRYCCGGDDIHECVPDTRTNPPNPPACVPASPRPACTSAVNACGMTNPGTRNTCTNACSASAPANSLCMPDATISVSPTLLRPGDPTTVTWTSEYAGSCTVTGGSDTWTGTSGTRQSSPVNGEIDYSIMCVGQYNAFSTSTTAKVRVIPMVEEN